MSKLILLLNGDSVRSCTIKSIRIAEFVPISDYNKREIKDRVLIDHGTNNVSMIEFDNIGQCKTYVFELTKLVNEDEELEKAQLEEIMKKRKSDLVGGLLVISGYVMFFILCVAIVIIEEETK